MPQGFRAPGLPFSFNQPQEPSLSGATETGSEVNQADPKVSRQTSLFRISQNLGDAQAQWFKSEPETSISGMETVAFEFTQTKTAQEKIKSDGRPDAEGGASQSGLDI